MSIPENPLDVLLLVTIFHITWAGVGDFLFSIYIFIFILFLFNFILPFHFFSQMYFVSN